MGKPASMLGTSIPNTTYAGDQLCRSFQQDKNTGTTLKYLLLIQHNSDNECDSECLSVLGFQAKEATALMSAIWLQVKTTDFVLRVCEDKVSAKNMVSLFPSICLLLHYLFFKLVQTSFVVLFTRFKSPIRSTASPDWPGLQNPC